MRIPTIGAGAWVLRDGSTGAVWMEGFAPHTGTTPVVTFDQLVEMQRTIGVQSAPISAYLEAYR